VRAQSVQRWATGWTIGVLGFDSRRGLGIFLTTASRTALGPTQPPIQWVPGALSLGVKRPGLEAVHSLPSSAEVKNAWSYTSTPQMAWCLAKHRDNFTFTLQGTLLLALYKWKIMNGYPKCITLILNKTKFRVKVKFLSVDTSAKKKKKTARKIKSSSFKLSTMTWRRIGGVEV
jgi:hypothetical protein